MSGAGGVDAGIPLAAGRIGQGGGNTLAAPGALMDTLSKIQQMQLFPGQLQRQQQEIQQGDINIQSGRLGVQKSQQELTAYKNNLIANGMMPLFQKGDGATLQDATNTLGQLHAAGYDTDGLTAMLAKSGVTGGQPLLTVLKSAVMQAHPELGVPKIEYQNIGGSLVPVNTNPFAGKLGQMGAPLDTTLTPNEKAERVATVGAGGQPGTVSKGSTVDQHGNALPQPAIQGGSPPPSSATPVLGGQSGNPPGFIATGMQPGFTEAKTKTAERSADVFHQISTAGDAARGQDALLSTMQSEAQNFRPGPGADMAMTVKRTILGIGAQFGVAFGVDPAKLAAQESVDKIANQLADAQGAGSDARLHVNQGANPSAHNTPAGLDLIIRQLRGNTDYLKARQQLGAAYSDKADSQGFLANVAGNLDPRVFQYNRLTPEQKGDYYKGISDKETFRKAYEYAEKSKLIGAPGG